MAVEGGTTQAYKMQMIGGNLQRVPTTALKAGCAKPLPATSSILKGEMVIVAGADAVVVARLVELEKIVSRLQSRLREVDVEWVE